MSSTAARGTALIGDSSETAVTRAESTATTNPLVVGGSLAAIFAFNLLTLMRFPAPFVDEPWNAARSLALLQTGRPFGVLDSGFLEQFPGYWTFFPLLGTAIHAAAIWIGGLDLFPLRLTSLLFGMGLLAIIYGIANRLYGARVALVATLLVGCGHAFLLSSHLGRHDIIDAVMGYGAILLYLTDTSERFSWKALAAGLLCGLVLDVHLGGIIFGLALTLMFVAELRVGILRNGRFWSFATGGTIGIAYFLAIHVLPYPQTFFSLFSYTQGATTRTPAGLLSGLQPWLDILGATAQRLDLLGPILLIGVIMLLRRRLPADKRLLLLGGCLLLGYLFVIRPKHDFYTILIAPLASLLIAPLLLEQFTRKAKPQLKQLLLFALVVSLLAAYVLRGLTPLASDPLPEFNSMMSSITATVPPGSRVMASSTYWLGMQDRTYFLLEQVPFYERQHPDAPFEEAFQQLHPDYIILDGPATWPAEVEKMLAARGSQLLNESTQNYGQLRIFKMDWN